MPPTPSSNFLKLPSHLRALVAAQPFLRTAIRVTTPGRGYASSASAQSSVSQTEVSHFSHLASEWWDPHGSSRLLHLMNPLRHDFIHRCRGQEEQTPGKKLELLDIGCGGGIFAESAARRNDVQSVVAIDPTPECIAVAKKHARCDPLLLQPGRLTYLNTAIEDLSTNLPPSPQGQLKQFDIITVFEVLEHIQRPAPFLLTALQHLRPGGWLIGSTIARHPASWFTTKFVAEEVLRMVPRGTHSWEQYINPQELRDWARQQVQLGTSDGLSWQVQGVVYVPGLGWKEIGGSEGWGNYFFGVRKRG
jgi:polyprenyldihydroxybenzoate methyltransferase / 3-demethylubiquinol 3-O-methyltransferase